MRKTLGLILANLLHFHLISSSGWIKNTWVLNLFDFDFDLVQFLQLGEDYPGLPRVLELLLCYQPDKRMPASRLIQVFVFVCLYLYLCVCICICVFVYFALTAPLLPTR